MSLLSPNKILLIKHGSLGDIVFALEPILSIKKKFNNSVIDLVTEEKFIPFFKKTKMFDQYLVDNRAGLFSTFALIRKIINGKYDLIIDLQNSKRTNFYNFFTKIFSRSRINGSRSFVHDRYVIPVQGKESPTQGLYNQLKLLGINKSDHDFSWLVSDKEDQSIEHKNVVLIIPGVSKSGRSKQWSSIKYQQLCSFLESKGYYICLVGTKHDAMSFQPILDGCKNIINLIDKSPPEIIYSVATKSKLIISNDTGPGHIAALSKVNILWLALDNSVTKANLSFQQNNHMLLKNKMEDLSVNEVQDFIIKNKLLDKVE
ncbi:glycosyltransferase family 9 protein [Pelagibacterales bacterium SAG-MED31]|nr:glycosyltransferase family 9 protein [Pelagibacterales bacterium SAG-MED31]